MPVYCFKCESCGATKEELRTIERRNDVLGCDDCATTIAGLGSVRKVMVRDLRAERCASGNQEYDRPVFSTSMGVAPKQVKEAQAKHPWMKYQQDGRIRIDSPAEYKRVRKALHMQDVSKR